MIQITAAVEHYLGNVHCQSLLCDIFTDSSCSNLVAAVAIIVLAEGRGAYQRLTCDVVNDLCADVRIGTLNDQTRARSGAGDVLSDSLMSLDASQVFIFS